MAQENSDLERLIEVYEVLNEITEKEMESAKSHGLGTPVFKCRRVSKGQSTFSNVAQPWPLYCADVEVQLGGKRIPVHFK